MGKDHRAVLPVGFEPCQFRIIREYRFNDTPAAVLPDVDALTDRTDRRRLPAGRIVKRDPCEHFEQGTTHHLEKQFLKLEFELAEFARRPVG